MRVNAAIKIEQAWTNMAASQSDSKTMKKVVKPWQDQMNSGAPKPNQAAGFIGMLGKGF